MESRWRRTEVFAVANWSSAPQKYFRDAVVEMIIENGINHQEELKEVLICYLRFNTDEYHVDMNINMFQQMFKTWEKIMEERLKGKQNDTYSKLGSEETGVSVEKVKAKW
ncbi:transcription repressor OFP5-like [Brassica napus]|uniref:transcription repressor OFP5-like n=1 Tax=Brassica napus TaxID=3708 RepID=UPI000BBEB8D3|nr:transcription repressor OFP5-like [Brassica napus]